jgi:hypothetical protein
MNKALKQILPLMIIALAYFSCQKGINFDLSVSGISAGTLQFGGNGDCLPKNISGDYIVSVPLIASNLIEAQVDVISAGTYKIFTDTVNGYSFSASGSFAATGIQKIVLTGIGTPLSAGNNVFQINYNNSSCKAIINVLSGISSIAEFTLPGAVGDCSGAVVNGIYATGNSLNGTNTVAINANITKTGSYTISTAITNGMTFSASGNFSNTGLQAIILQGSGTPVNAAATPINISAGGTTCSFTVSVTASSFFDYFPRTAGSNWTYEIDDNSSDTARFFAVPPLFTIGVNSYNIFMVSRNDISDSSGYYRKSAADYYEYMNLGDFIGFDKPLWGEYIFLKDNLAEGGSWKSAAFTGDVTIAGLSTVSMTIRFSSSILQKDVPVSVITSLGTRNYTYVTVVEEKYERFIGGNWVDITAQVGSFRKYYSRGVGLIKYEAYNGSGNVSATFELRKYQVF